MVETFGNELPPEKRNHLHGFCYYSDLCRDIRFLCMSTLIHRITLQSACQCTSWFCNWPNLFFTRSLYAFAFENKKKSGKFIEKSMYKWDLSKWKVWNIYASDRILDILIIFWNCGCGDWWFIEIVLYQIVELRFRWLCFVESFWHAQFY